MPRLVAAIAAALIPVLLWASARAGAAPDFGDASALLAKHRAYAGWQLGDGTFKTLQLSGDFTDKDGAITENSVERRIGFLYRNTHFFPKRGTSTESGFTGSVVWRSDANGFTTPVYGDSAKYEITYSALMNEAFTSLHGEARGTATIDGKSVGIVRVSIPNAESLDLYIDSDTGALVQAVLDPGGTRETTVHILSYEEVSPGKRLVKSLRFGNEKGTYTYAKIEPNVILSDSDLHPLPATASWSFGNGTAVPITLTPQRILIDAKVNGVSGRFILDTGASAILLNKRFADRAGVKPLRDPASKANTLYGSLKTEARKVDTLTLGDNTLAGVIVTTADLNNEFGGRDYRGLDRENYAGLIGYSLFAGAVVHLDLAASTMTISRPDDFDDSTMKNALPLLVDVSTGIPAIPMTIDGSVDVKASLDSGDPDAVIFGPDLIFKHHVLLGTKFQGARAGIGSAACGTLDRLTIGPIVYTTVDACEWNNGAFNDRDILVGLDFLRHFNLTFDYPHGRLFLEPIQK